MDERRFGEFFADDARLVFGNADPLIGRGDIVAGIGGFFTTIAGLHHELVNTWTVGSDTIAEISVTYRRCDGEQVTLPAALIYHCNADAKIDDYRIFVDLAPVYT